MSALVGLFFGLIYLTIGFTITIFAVVIGLFIIVFRQFMKHR